MPLDRYMYLSNHTIIKVGDATSVVYCDFYGFLLVYNHRQVRALDALMHIYLQNGWDTGRSEGRILPRQGVDSLKLEDPGWFQPYHF